MTQEQLKQRKALLWTVGILTLILVGLLVAALLMGLNPPARMSVPTEPTTVPTTVPPTTVPPTEAPTEAPTEPTLPPPEANPYGPLDFQYDWLGRYLTCQVGKSILGIDVSAYQENIDWNLVRYAGVEFVMIRVGYRGYESGKLVKDNWADRHYRGAKAAGLKVGAYFFSQAVSAEEAVEEAEYTLELLSNWELDMPIAYDWEYISDEARTAEVDGETLTAATIAFLDTIEAAGYDALAYFNWNQSFYKLSMPELKDYHYWLAMYSDRMRYPYKLSMWQYTNTGTVPGIDGTVDLNLYFIYEEDEVPEETEPEPTEPEQTEPTEAATIPATTAETMETTGVTTAVG